jgi:hypothetical protein
MASIEHKISKQPAARITLEIIRKPGKATTQNVFMAGYKIGLPTMHGTKKHKKYYL